MKLSHKWEEASRETESKDISKNVEWKSTTGAQSASNLPSLCVQGWKSPVVAGDQSSQVGTQAGPD